MVLGHLTVASRKLVSVSRLSLVVVLALVLTSVYSITREGTQYAQAAAPTTLNFQGRLLASGGNLVPDGNYSIEFKLYNASSSAGSSQGNCTGDANCLWTETRTGGNQVEIKNGYFSAYLGDVSALPTNIWNQQLWLTMNVHNGTGWDGEMTPRIRLTSVPYAFRATIAESAETLFKNTGSFTGTVDFATMTADRRFLFPDTSLATTASPGTICVYNGTASNCPAASGSAYYIQNDTVLQTATNFNIQGRNDTGTGTDGTVVGTFQGAAGGQTVDLVQYKSSGGTVLGAVTAAGNLEVATSLDVRTAGTLNIGTATATAITIGDAGVTTTNAGALTVTQLGTFNGGLTVASNLTVTQAGNIAFQRNTTDYTATGVQDDINFGTGALFRITSASALTINGIAGGADGRIITLVNASANAVSIGNSASGTPANHVITGTGSALSVPAGSSIQLAYDSGASAWRVVGGVATSGGGANQQLSNLSGTVAVNASLTPGTDNTLDLGSSSNSWQSVYADTSVLTPLVGRASAGTLSLGTDANSTAITISRTGVTTTVAGALTVSEALSANAGISASGGAVSLAGNAASSLTTSAGALTITSNQAATWSTSNGNLTIQAGSGVVSLGSSTSLTAAGALTITSGGTDALALDTSGAATLNLGLTNANAVSISRTGVTTTINGALTVTENLTVANTGNVAFQRNTNDYTATGTQSDIDFGTGALFRITSASALTINSIAGGVDGRLITLVNASANPVTIANETGATVTNRILTGTGGATLIPVDGSIQLAYDSGASRWRVIGGVATSGGGANQQLSNLSGTIAVNSHLTTNGDNLIDLGSSSNSWRTLYADTSVLTPNIDTSSATTLLIGNTTASAITLGRSGITTTNAGALTVSELLTGSAGATIGGGAIALTGNAASSFTTSAGALTLTSAAAAVWSTAAGNLTVDSAAALQLGTTNATSVSISKTGVTTTINGALTVTELGTFNGGLTVDSNLTVTQDGNVAFQRNTTDYTATGAQDSINFGTGALFRVTSASALTINGIAGGADGRIITLVNASANAVTIGNNASATPANYVVTGTGGSLSVPAGSTVQLAYDSASSLWRVIGGTATAGGGANQQLSNLSGTVAVNASLTPGTDGTLDLGSALNSWRTLYADTSVLTPTVDTATATTLNIGTVTANAVSISRTGVTTTVHGALTVSEATQLNANLTVANTGNVAFQANATSYTVTGTQELTLGTGVLHRITTATSTPILTGLTGGADGRIITLVNASANSLTIQNDSGGTAANRIITGSGVDSLIPAGGSITLAYDSASSRWRIIGSSTGSIQLQASTPGTAQTGNFNVSGTGIAGTALQSPLFDTATAVALGIGTTNATNISIGHNAGTIAIDGTNFDLSTAGVLTLAGSQTRDITTANAATATGLTVKPGDATGANVQGATLSLQGGAATNGNANGGSVTIAGGAGVGTGTQGLVNLSTTAFTSASVYTASSTPPTINNISVSDVNLFATIPVNATTATAIVSVPDPTISAIGRVLYITARDSSTDFTLRLNAASPVPIDIAMKRNSTATLIWNGDEWTAAGASSSTDLQSAYNNTLTSAGGAEIVLNPVGGNADGFTIRNNGTTPIIGGLLEVQSATGSNLLSVNNNATEYAVNGGGETTANFSTNWTNTTGGTITQGNDAGYFATGQYSTKVVTSGTNHGAKNVLSTALTAGMTYSVSFTAKAPTNFASLQVLYSPDGTTAGTTQCATAQTVTSANWTRIVCNFVASGSITSSNAILIRQTDATGRTFYIDNLSVQVNANMTFAADGSVNSALGSNWTQYDTGTGSTTLSRSTATLYDTDGAVQDITTANSGQGMRNNMSITPAISTQYRVSFYAKTEAGKAMSSSIAVGFLPAGGNGLPVAAQDCVDYNTRSVSDTNWTLITCIITTPSSGISDPDLVIYQTDSTARTFFVDALTITLNTNNSNNVQIGGANKGGPTTLLTLDRAASAPIAANNDAYLGSMYYDTTTGRIQCYEADGWGACGSSPDNIITLTPEYAGAVLGGPGNGGTAGIGVMTSEFCSTEAGVLTLGTLCANHEARNYYHWTSPQATEQIYSIYVAYKLPTTFKGFNDSNTVKLTALSDNLTNAIATLQVFRKKADGSGITACGASAQTINSSINTWQQTPYDSADETTCGFIGGDNIIFKIDMKSKSNGNIYVENLDFVYNNN